MVPAEIKARYLGWGLSLGVRCISNSITTNLISSSWSLAFTDKMGRSALQGYQDCCQSFLL